jgi:hypothetical protein
MDMDMTALEKQEKWEHGIIMDSEPAKGASGRTIVDGSVCGK